MADPKRFEALSIIVLLGALLACGGASNVESVRAGVYRSKCQHSRADCITLAEEKCEGSFKELSTESHAGGTVADVLPGPVTWHTITFECDSSGRQSATVTPEARRLEDEAIRRFEQDYIAADCANRKVGVATVRRCGEQVYPKVWSNQALARFFTKVCKLAEDELAQPIPDECAERLWRKWYASLVEQYYMMDVGAVRLRCDANPEECQDRQTLEAWCRESHNKRTVERYQQEKQQLETVAAAEHSAVRARLEQIEQQERAAAQQRLDALGQFSARLQGKPVFRCSADGQTCWQE